MAAEQPHCILSTVHSLPHLPPPTHSVHITPDPPAGGALRRAHSIHRRGSYINRRHWRRTHGAWALARMRAAEFQLVAGTQAVYAFATLDTEYEVAGAAAAAGAAPVHRRRMHGRFLVYAPPNLGLSRQLMHSPHSTRSMALRQPWQHCPERMGFTAHALGGAATSPAGGFAAAAAAAGATGAGLWVARREPR
jgi:hypothetical protein